jgi:hypothetical protein
MPVRRNRKPFLITDAAEDSNGLRRREIRYVTMMLIRALCLIAGAIIITTKPPLASRLVLCVLGMVLIPWLAVIRANDRPANTKAERAAAGRPRMPERPAVPGPRHDREVGPD